MAVYVDPMRPCLRTPQWKWRAACHLFADDLDDLHAFASRLGLRRVWFQLHRRLPHYDLTTSKRDAAVRHGAIEVDLPFVVARLRESDAHE